MEERDIVSIAHTWQLDLVPGISEADVLAALARRVTILLSRDAETFFQTMYRLDISEARLNQALYSENPAVSIASLIWDRQWEKARSRKQYQRPDVPDDELKW
jgi:hypothetical protein